MAEENKVLQETMKGITWQQKLALLNFMKLLQEEQEQKEGS